MEAEHYFHGLPSKPRLVARSSTHVWLEPRGPKARLIPKESSPLGFHPLREVWEIKVCSAVVEYLDTNGVKWTSLDPVRMGYAGDPSPSPIIWVGVFPGSLTAKVGIKVATDCKAILSTYSINDIQIEIWESEVIRSVKLYQPFSAPESVARFQEPFSTALGIPIAAADTPYIEGTGGLYISDPRYPGRIYLLTVRHVIFRPNTEPNELYEYNELNQCRKNVLLFSDSSAKRCMSTVEPGISRRENVVEEFKSQLRKANRTDERTSKATQDLSRKVKKEEVELKALKRFHADISRDWKKRKHRILGHVILSPPIGLDVSEEGFTEDWAVIELDRSKVNSTNFVGNVIDLSATSTEDLKSWMKPNPDQPSSFKPPRDGPFRFCGFISDEEMWKPDPNIRDIKDNPVIMVIKNGCGSGVSVGRLNTIRSVVRYYFEGEPGRESKEVAVLPRDSNSGPFSIGGDSGSAVVDGMGRFAGLLTGGAGSTDSTDCTYITSGNFLRRRISLHGLEANFFPSPSS